METSEFQQLSPAWARRCALFDAQMFGQAAWSEAIWAHELARPDCLYLALVEPAAPHQSLGRLRALAGVGFGIEAEILTIAVEPQSRRHGIAQRLLHLLIVAAQMHGAAEIFLEVRASDSGAQALYRQAGFADVGLRKKYYPDDDAVIMRKTFVQ